jgi:hypothetical protein
MTWNEHRTIRKETVFHCISSPLLRRGELGILPQVHAHFHATSLSMTMVARDSLRAVQAQNLWPPAHSKSNTPSRGDLEVSMFKLYWEGSSSQNLGYRRCCVA